MKISEDQYKTIVEKDQFGRNLAIYYIRDHIADGYDSILNKLISVCETCSDLYDIHTCDTFVSDDVEELYYHAYRCLIDYLGIDWDQYAEDVNDLTNYFGG